MDFTDRPDWGNVQSIFAQAIELPPAERDSFLAQTCSTDPDVRREVERLLRAHDSAGGFLESPDPQWAAALIGSAPDTDLPPDRIGAYRIVRRLGGGGMGVVYLAHDTRLDRPVALKLLRDRYGSDDLAKRRLMAEAQAASALDHPHIVPVYEIGEAPDGRMFIAMAWGEGESLADRLRRGPLAPREAARITRQIADALAAAHRRGIVHRDVKPANILLTPVGARLVDFGIALVSGRELDAVGSGAGTPAYMSPEQSRGAELDHASDLWSLGVVLYEMLAGRRPFRADNRAILVHALEHSAPEPVRAIRPEVPAPLAQLAEQCLETDAAKRPAGAAAVVASLDAFLERTAPRERASGRRARMVAGLATAGLVVAGAVAAIAVWTSPPDATANGAVVVAVMPFAPVAADSVLDRLGRELAITLSTGLDGTAGMRVVDPITVLGMVDDRSGLTLERAAALASGLGAGQMIYGQLTRSGPDARLDAAVYTTKDLTVLGRTTAVAPVGQITTLTDSAALGLLTSGWTDRAVNPPNLAAITTASVPALRAYLEGELAISQSRFRTAPPAFARAIAADSTFWFAYWRYMYSLAWHDQPVDSAIVAVVREHHDDFPRSDRLLVEAGMVGGHNDRIDALKAITDQFPSWWPAWFDLGDQLTHHGPFLGRAFDEARDALERVVELNPRFVPAWEHLLWIAIHRADTTRSGIILDRLAELRLDTLMRSEWDLQTLDYYVYLDHLARTRGEPDHESAELGARILAEYNGPLEAERLAVSLSLYGFHRAQVDMTARVVARGPAARVEAAQDWARAVASAGRGDWDAALQSLRRYSAAAHPQAGLRALGLAVAGAWLGAVDPDATSALRTRALQSPLAETPDGAAEIAWLDGLVACTRDDADALRNARGRLATSTATYAPSLNASLAAMQTAMQGDVGKAGRAMARLEWDNADVARQFGYGPRHPFLLAIDRLAAGHWLLSAGDTAQARRMLLVHETELPGSLQPMPVANVVLGSLALPTLARIEEFRGQQGRARRLLDLFRERTDLAPDRWLDGAIPVCGRRSR